MHNFFKTLPQERRRGGSSHRIDVLSTRPCDHGELCRQPRQEVASAYRFVSRNAHSSGAGGVFVRHIGSCFCDLISRTNSLQVPPPPGHSCLFLSPTPGNFVGSYSLFRGSQSFDRTELFGAVTCMTGMVGCGGATTTVTQQIVPTVQVFFVGRLSSSSVFEELYEYFRADYVCQIRTLQWYSCYGAARAAVQQQPQPQYSSSRSTAAAAVQQQPQQKQFYITTSRRRKMTIFFRHGRRRLYISRDVSIPPTQSSVTRRPS